MANAANSFLSGFTGGMGAMGQMIDRREQRDYNAQKMEWMKEDRALAEQNRNNQQYINNTMASYELYREMNKEQKAEFESGVVDLFNNDEKIKSAINRNLKPGEHKNISGMYSAPNGIGFNIDVRDDNGKVIRNGRLTEEGLSDGSDKDMVIPMRDFLTELGKNKGMVDESRLRAANILARGGKNPNVSSEKPSTYSYEMKDGGKVIVEQFKNGRRVVNSFDKTGAFTRTGGMTGNRTGSVADSVLKNSGINTETKDQPAPAPTETKPKEKSELKEVASKIFTPSTTGQKIISGLSNWNQDWSNRKEESKANPKPVHSISDLFNTLFTPSPTGQKIVDKADTTIKNIPVVAGMAGDDEIFSEAEKIAATGDKNKLEEYLSQYDKFTIRRLFKKVFPESPEA